MGDSGRLLYKPYIPNTYCMSIVYMKINYYDNKDNLAHNDR